MDTGSPKKYARCEEANLRDVLVFLNENYILEYVRTLAIVLAVTLPFAITIAFGGVPTGKMNAKEIDEATGARTKRGGTPRAGPAHARIGSKIFAAATFDIKLVLKMPKMQARKTTVCKERGPS